MRLPDFLSKWGILFRRLSGRYRRQLLPPEFGPSSNTETLGEILEDCGTSEDNGGSFQKLFHEVPKYVDFRVFLELHKEMMETDGQKQYIRDMGLLESALHRLQWMFYYSEAQSIPSLFKMAAALGEAGHLAISMFLAINGYDLDADDESTEKITIDVATGDVNIDILESWISSNVKKIE
ncbi:4631_t:CDS:2 [Diversispora eburnea]|uniref:4631_t:CDS:1 n=1 Tax=Diversispora eburnea TaxID=1213867 RepID=A0A9N9GNR6_9GLOM|nr:4631_t:CDS:2 [Diversispora eburnea]